MKVGFELGMRSAQANPVIERRAAYEYWDFVYRHPLHMRLGLRSVFDARHLIRIREMGAPFFILGYSGLNESILQIEK